MKNIAKYILAAVLGTLFSCNDYLDIVPDQVPTMDNIFADRNTTLRYLNSCYWALPWDNNDSSPAWWGSMELIPNRTKQLASNLAAQGLNSASSGWFNHWSGTGGARNLYAGIREADVLIENVNSVEDLSVNERNRMVAEGKMIKAYNTFALLRQYGPICLMRETPQVGESKGAHPYRDKVDDCFQYTVDLLNQVIDSKNLPIVITDKYSELGRFTHAAACMLKAKVLLYWASPLFNGNTDYHNFRDHNDEPFFNQKYDASRWQQAVEACKVAMDACAEGDIHLYGDADYKPQYSTSDTTRLINILRSSISESASSNQEIVFRNGTTATTLSGLQTSLCAKLEAGSNRVTGQISVPLHIVDRFYSNHGVPITEDTAWIKNDREKFNNRFSTRQGDEAHKYYIEKGETTAAGNFDREPRFYAFLGFDRGRWYGNTFRYIPDERTPFVKARFNEPANGQWPNDYNCTGYFAKKLVNTSSFFRSASEFWESPFSYNMRYTDLVLMYAEALNEIASDDNAQPDPLVYQLLDMIRQRAGLEGVRESWQKYTNKPAYPLTKAGMREIIRMERNIELAFEQMDYWDSRRWKTAPNEQNRPVQGFDIKQETADKYYSVKDVYTQKFTFRDYLSPIPEDDIIKNPRLKQNPQW